MNDNVKKLKRRVTDYEKTFAKDIHDKGLLSEIYKTLVRLKNNKPTLN